MLPKGPASAMPLPRGPAPSALLHDINLDPFCLDQTAWDNPDACSDIQWLKDPKQFEDFHYDTSGHMLIPIDLSKRIHLSPELQITYTFVKNTDDDDSQHNSIEEQDEQETYKFWIIQLPTPDGQTRCVRIHKIDRRQDNCYYALTQFIGVKHNDEPYSDRLHIRSILFGMMISEPYNGTYIIK